MIPLINPLEQICLSQKIQWEVFFFLKLCQNWMLLVSCFFETTILAPEIDGQFNDIILRLIKNWRDK